MEKYCKNCGRVFKDSDFKICPYCGNQLSTRVGRQPIPRKLRHQVFQRDGYRCRECGATNKQTRLHVDHIKPVAKGGTNDLSNLQTLCEACNKAKYTDEWVGGSNTNFHRNLQDDLYEINRKQREINLSIYNNKKVRNHHNSSKRSHEVNNSQTKTTNLEVSNGDTQKIEMNDTLKKIISEFKICPDINIVSKKVGISAIQIKRWYRQRNGEYELFHNAIVDLNPNMNIDEFSLDSLSTLEQINFIASSFKKNKNIKLVSEHTGVSEIQIQKWFKLGKRGMWPYKILYDKISKFM